MGAGAEKGLIEVRPSAAPRRAAWFVATALSSTVALLVAAEIADDSGPHRGAVTALLLYVAFVGLPGAVSQLAARFTLTRVACLVIMAGTGFWAGWLMGSSDDAQAGLAALWVPIIGIALAGVVLVAEGIALRWRTPTDSHPTFVRGAAVSIRDRVAALLIDVVLATAVLYAPLTGLSDAQHEVIATVLGIVGGVAYFGTSWQWRGATVGQALLRLRVVNASAERLTPRQSFGRATLLVVEILVSLMLLFIPLMVELVLATSGDGRTFADRLARTRVVQWA